MSCYAPSGAPIPCSGWTVYDSYVTDPRFAKYFTIAWTTFFAVVFVATLPSIVRFLFTGTWRRFSLAGVLGVWEDVRGYHQIDALAAPSSRSSRTKRARFPKVFWYPVALLQSITLRTLPLPKSFRRFQNGTASCHATRPLLPFSLGTLFVALLIPALFLATIFPASQLSSNSNRLGFLSLATIPPLFVLSAKNGAISILLGRGWTGVNFLHRWLGRVVVVLTFAHGVLWTYQWNRAGEMGVFLSQDKARRGIGAFACLLLIAIVSAKPFRRVWYSAFFVCHYVGIIGFLVFVNRHTVYARGWATWAVIVPFTFDIASRVLSMRVRYVKVEALDGGMVRIIIPNLVGGWRAGQHLSIRLSFVPPSPSILSSFRPFEAHTFSIANTPSSTGVLNSTSSDRGIELYARSLGDGTWTGDLYDAAHVAQLIANNSGQPKKKLHMLALVEGPYGGLGKFVELDQENILLVAGGSGMSFILGMLDEVVGTRIRRGKGGKIQVVWAVRDRAHIQWFAEPLRKILEAVESISDLTLTLRIYLTCDLALTTLEDSPSTPSSALTTVDGLGLPHTQLHYARPALSQIVREQVGAALAPCGNCFPVCRCGEQNSDGVCVNDEEDCCGVVAPSTERSGDYEKDTVTELPVLASGAQEKSCCGGGGGGANFEDEKDGDLLPPFSVKETASCCAPIPNIDTGATKPAVCGGGCCAKTGSGCCSGAVEGAAEKEDRGPLRVRTEGFGIAVCGPTGMVGELRNAVASVPLSRQVRIGGITLHSEHFSV